MAASQLRAHRIECWLESDDAGGMYPPLLPVKLLVASDQLEEARQVLNEPAGAVEFPPGLGESAVPPPRMGKPPSLLKFTGGLVIGIVLGVVWHIVWLKTKDWGEEKYQYESEEQVWRNGKWVQSKIDRNGDNRFDQWRSTTSAESDDNFDGQVDAWMKLDRLGRFTTGRWDSDFNGVPDAAIIYEHDLAKQIDWQPNGTNVVLLRQSLQHGILREELHDLNGDGQFDISIRYNPFQKAVATNDLRKRR